MSYQATEWARRQVTGGKSRKVLLFAIATYADADGFCWPSQETLAKDAEMSVDTVQRQLKLLEKQKLLTREHMPKRRGKWRGHCYRLNIGSAVLGSAPGAKTTALDLRPNHTASGTETRPHSLRHKPSRETSSENLPGRTPTSVEKRQIAFQKQYEGIEIIQHRIAVRIGGTGWLILGEMSESELARVSALERQGRLDDESLLEAVAKVQLTKLRE
ncbi:helix-turn-helix domain-containing protein [Tardiphaga sp.]|uniref:helix-turn-helix domain-containing protein n=1 Tax=Tardiphaga sp. TaxID=1926292 RepID=UPI002603A7A3|nr:helix-turn-helix domain-containing protein [Tardiphaga sp.]MDB5620434.1 pyocin large subunit [Tardiphaga sp.]